MTFDEIRGEVDVSGVCLTLNGEKFTLEEYGEMTGRTTDEVRTVLEDRMKLLAAQYDAHVIKVKLPQKPKIFNYYGEVITHETD